MAASSSGRSTTQSLATWPRRSNALTLPARYHDRKPRPAKDHEEWPLGKLLCPSLITLATPSHRTPLVMLSYFGTPSGKQRQKKLGRGRPTPSLMASVRTPVMSTEKRRPRMAWCMSYTFLRFRYNPTNTTIGPITAYTCAIQFQSSHLSVTHRHRFISSVVAGTGLKAVCVRVYACMYRHGPDGHGVALQRVPEVREHVLADEAVERLDEVEPDVGGGDEQQHGPVQPVQPRDLAPVGLQVRVRRPQADGRRRRHLLRLVCHGGTRREW
uniref:Uncharacterized protein n=1 Tax=Zea mays TaxID=4577 RepID=C0PM55_MAIZE|nr:unknown [Zea mays]